MTPTDHGGPEPHAGKDHSCRPVSLDRSRRRFGQREREMYRLRTVEGLTHAEIARRYQLGPERVRQLLRAYARNMTAERPSPSQLRRAAWQIRRERKMALAEAHAQQIIAAWRTGGDTRKIAGRFGLPGCYVEQVIRMTASPGDRADRARARRVAADPRAQSDPVKRTMTTSRPSEGGERRAASSPVSVAASILGERVRSRRGALGVSQETLAGHCGLHWTFVGQVERGRRNLSLHNLLKLAAGLEMDAGELVRGLAPPGHQAEQSGPGP